MGLVALTVKEHQVVTVGNDIEILVRKRTNQGGRQYLLVIKAPNDLRILRTERRKINIEEKKDEIRIPT